MGFEGIQRHLQKFQSIFDELQRSSIGVCINFERFQCLLSVYSVFVLWGFRRHFKQVQTIFDGLPRRYIGVLRAFGGIQVRDMGSGGVFGGFRGISEPFQEASDDLQWFQRVLGELHGVEGILGGFHRHFKKFQRIFDRFSRRYRNVT